MAKELKDFADVLEKAEDFNSALHDLIHKTLKMHKRIIFNGNGYDESWIKEAQKRGLSNYASTPEALAHYLDKKKRQCLYKDRCAVFDGIIVKV